LLICLVASRRGYVGGVSSSFRAVGGSRWLSIRDYDSTRVDMEYSHRLPACLWLLRAALAPRPRAGRPVPTPGSWSSDHFSSTAIGSAPCECGVSCRWIAGTGPYVEPKVGELAEQVLQRLGVLRLAAHGPPAGPVANDVVGDDRRNPLQVGRRPE